MARARYQVLVIPYCIMDGQARFCVFRRNDLDIWQFIAGGGEDEDASILPVFFGLDGLLWSFPAADLLTFLIAAFFIRQTYRELSDVSAVHTEEET